MSRLIVALFLVTLAGCSTIGNPALMNDTIMDQIKVGETSKAQVSTLLGKPSSITSSSINGHTSEIWGYGYASSEMNPLAFVPIVNLFVMACCEWYSTESRSIAVGFSSDGIVQTLSKGAMNMPIGGTIPVQMHNSTVIQTQP